MIPNKKILSLGRVEVDQSVRIEELNKDTILGLANKDFKFSAILPRKVKTRLYEIFRQKGLPKKFAPRVFAASVIVLLQKAKVRPSDLVLDIEYPSYEREMITNILKFYPKMHVYFTSIGKNSLAHELVYFGHKGEFPVNSKLEYSEISRVLETKKDRRTVTPRVHPVPLFPKVDARKQ